jgi:hypothetical protein
MINELRELLDMIANIDRDEDGDAMLDAAGLDELKALAKRVDEQHFGKID